LCLSWRCNGELEFVKEDRDNYNLQLLNKNYAMLRPEEHTAMVPHKERERLENLFKGNSEAVNAFVCTPTLELGVDIGQLDAVLMRNVPPLPANYWQRAGRAGRRHRMAVGLTYCRSVSHDRAYFADPFKLLAGRVDPPAFNLRNDLMVAKHVHATVISRLHQYTRDASFTDEQRNNIKDTLKTCLPDRISSYLFEDGLVRESPFDLSPLKTLMGRYEKDLVQYVTAAFSQGWPEADAEVTKPEVLMNHIRGMVSELETVIGRLSRRLQWALAQIKRLNVLREKQGDLEPEDDTLFRRCDTLVKRLKGTIRRRRREAEGYDDVNAYGMLSAEGFLPGYGLERGSVLGTAEIPFWRTGAMEFALPRPSSVALREYVPGNLIYANGNRFVARRFHRDVDEERAEMPVFEISTERHAVKVTNAGAAPGALGAKILQTIAVCDVDLVHQSHISDEEDLRFQMGVAVHGIERDQHNGGKAYNWGPQALHHRRGVRLRLVNVGANSAIERFDRYGYPVCRVCGQSVSPLSSDKQRDHFDQSHQERCGRPPAPVGFYADVVADVLSLPACSDQETAYSVLETLRMAATNVLNMHMEDLQLLVIGHVDRDEVDGLLWDPMPGGSGLIDQICECFDEVVNNAVEIVETYPSACDTSCVDCLQTFRNGYYHKYLNRELAWEILRSWGNRITLSHEIAAKRPFEEPSEGTHPVNEVERKLRHLLLSAGFEEGVRGEQLRLDRAIGTTTPDVIYRADHHAEDEGAMTRHFRRLAGYLREDLLRAKLRKDSSWFQQSEEKKAASKPAVLRLVRPTPEKCYVDCVPLIPLKAAAGYFGDPSSGIDLDLEWGWVEVDTRRKLRPGMFVAQVVGKSMEPGIPDGAYCLFSTPVTGTRQGLTVVVQMLDDTDPETGESYTVKRYESRKVTSEEGAWRHVKIVLKPDNRDFQPIELTCEDEGSVQVVAELVEVLG